MYVTVFSISSHKAQVSEYRYIGGPVRTRSGIQFRKVGPDSLNYIGIGDHDFQDPMVWGGKHSWETMAVETILETRIVQVA